MKVYMRKVFFCSLVAGMCLLGACSSSYSLVSVEGGRIPVSEVYDANPDEQAALILKPYQQHIDSLMKPVIGHAEAKLTAYRPESPLSNLIADILCESAALKTGVKADVGVMNMGGIRNLLNQGEITFSSIYEISPFQNALVVVTVTGDVLLELFEQIAAVHGEGISGAQLEISKDGKLLSAKVGGKEVDEQSEYRIATIDYLAEGNDHMEAFRKATEKTVPENAILRDLFIEYVKRCEAGGRPVTAKVEGRIVER